jgi:gas vesicle protein
MADNGNGGGAVLAAFILGAIAGAATALLMAPTTGEEARRYLADRARESKDKASEAAQKSREFLDRQRESLSTAVERGKEAYNRARATDDSYRSGDPEETA